MLITVIGNWRLTSHPNERIGACCSAFTLGVVWCGVLWRGAVRCDAVCGAVQCGVLCCAVLCCGAVWCGVAWCGVVQCGVVSMFCALWKLQLMCQISKHETLF